MDRARPVGRIVSMIVLGVSLVVVTPLAADAVTLAHPSPGASASTPSPLATPVAAAAPTSAPAATAASPMPSDSLPNEAREPAASATPAAAPSPSVAVSAADATPIAAAGPVAVCGEGYAYSIRADGTVTQFVPSTNTVTTWSDGWSGLGVRSANGLAIDVNNGGVMYAYERSTDSLSIASVLKYTPATNTWEKIPDSSFPRSASNSLVAGAVNLSTGTFVFGGFDRATFQIYQWDPTKSGSAAYSQLGYIATQSTETNGDLGFDRSGNLYVVGSGSTTTVYSVTAATLAAAAARPGNNELTASRATSGPSILTSTNGIAFRPDGTVYLSNASRIIQVDPTTWQPVAGGANTAIPAANGALSTDLASCDSPANITVRKSVAGRVAPSDQFTLSVMNGASTIATATTTGSSTGVQKEQIGPLPVVQGRTYTVAELAASGTMADYSSSFNCVSDGQVVASGSGPGGPVTVPNRAAASVVCTITNTPLVASVTIHKTVEDLVGQNPVPGAGWQLGAATTATTGAVRATPSAPTQVSPGSGDVAWRIAFDAVTSRATVRVSETQKAGWEFISGSCLVTSLSGSTRTVAITGASGADVSGVAAGDAVACTFTNKPSSATFTLRKVVDDTYGGSATATDWVLSATGPQTVRGITGASAVTNAVVPVGTYALRESEGPAGYSAGAWVCEGGQVTGSSVVVTANTTVTCTVTNASKPGAVLWTKSSRATGGLLAGSEWTVTGPGMPKTVVVDCVALPCAGPDTDPAPGTFRLGDLAWGTYTATETRAPVGYVAAGMFSFTVSATSAGLTQDLGAQMNDQQRGVALPLTGGWGTDAFVLAGGALLALALGCLAALRLRRSRAFH